MNTYPFPLKHPVLDIPERIDYAEVTVPSEIGSTADAHMLHDAITAL